MSHFDRTYLTYVGCILATAYLLTLLWVTLGGVVSFSPSRAMTEKDLDLSGSQCGISLHFDP